MADNVDPDTGEVLAVVKYDPRAYLASLSKGDGLAIQHKLAAAYDAAVLSLIGPNDVQNAEGRTFKKKSAWRKLARYFGISVEIARVENTTQGAHFLSTVTARAVAPWGQSYEEVGACCTDEATGRRVISVADAIATASTRASNRAVSNLIAMGEVSAEEIGDRRPMDNGERDREAPQPRRQQPSSVSAATDEMPFGKSKGTKLAEMETADLSGALKWAGEKGKFIEFQQAARIELDRRGSLSEQEDGDMGNDGDPGHSGE